MRHAPLSPGANMEDFSAAHLRAEYYRDLARTLRAHVSELTDSETRDTMYALSAHYERLAEYVAPAKPADEPRPGAAGSDPASTP